MNLYNLHKNPEQLHKHKDRDNHVPVLVADKIHHQPPTDDDIKIYNKFLKAAGYRDQELLPNGQ